MGGRVTANEDVCFGGGVMKMFYDDLVVTQSHLWGCT